MPTETVLYGTLVDDAHPHGVPARLEDLGPLDLVTGAGTPDELSVDGAADALDALLGAVDRPDLGFAIVAP